MSLQDIVIEVKKERIKKKESKPENWVYLTGNSIAELNALIIQNTAFSGAFEVHIYQLEDVNTDSAKKVISNYIKFSEVIWDANKNWRLKHHKDLLEKLDRCSVFCLLYTDIN